MTPLKAWAVHRLVESLGIDGLAAMQKAAEQAAPGSKLPQMVLSLLSDLDAIGELLRFRADGDEAWRADHRCVCDYCGLTYAQHPFSRHRSYDDQPFLHRLCNGNLVKL